MAPSPDPSRSSQASPNRPETLSFDRFACITIQGGGVYGLSLLGQLQAVHESRFEPVALAGTSAGAIVSTLFWARLDPAAVLDAFQDLAARPGALTGLVGPFEQNDDGDVITPERVIDTVKELKASGSTASEVVKDRRLINECGLVWRVLFKWTWYVWAYLKLGHVPKLAGRGVWAWNRRGVFAGEELQHFLDQLLRRSPILEQNVHLLPPPARDEHGQPIPDGRWLTFRDFQRVQDQGYVELPESGPSSGQDGSATRKRVRPYFPPLFLAATEVTTRRLELINSVEPRYLDWPVVKAVRASAGFPGFFTPVDHDVFETDDGQRAADPGPAGGERSYVDGGVIANFPAFVFGNRFRRWLAETAAVHRPIYASYVTRPWVHLGLRLTNTRQARPAAGDRKRPGTFVAAMIDLFKGLARSELEDRISEFIPRSIPLGIEFNQTGGPAGVLDIDALRPHIVQTMHDQGYVAARTSLAQYRFNLPSAGPVEALLQDSIARASVIFPDDGTGGGKRPKFRANVFLPQGLALVLAYRANMDDPPEGAGPLEANNDRELRLDIRQGLTGVCYATRRPLLLNMQRFQAAMAGRSEVRENFNFTPATQSQIRRDRTWLLSVPIFDPEAAAPGRLPTDAVLQAAGRDYAIALEYPPGFGQNDRSVIDGAVFGVLNLDAGWDYDAVGLDPDPNLHREDVRVRTLVDIMRSCAERIGVLFSAEFPRRLGGLP